MIIVAVPDVHLEPGVPRDPSYMAVRKFIGDINPDMTVILGDLGEFECFNHHDKRKPLLLEGARYMRTVGLILGELDYIERHSREVKYTLGNHEYWVVQYVEGHPEVEGTIDLVKNLELDARGIEWCGRDEILRVGRLNFTHGWRINKYHSAAMANDVGDHILYGHVHDFQCYTPHFRKDQMPFLSMSCGCLCSKNPSYMKRTGASRWINGFVIIDVRDNGDFTPHWVPVINGAFSVLGHTWSA